MQFQTKSSFTAYVCTLSDPADRTAAVWAVMAVTEAFSCEVKGATGNPQILRLKEAGPCTACAKDCSPRYCIARVKDNTCFFGMSFCQLHFDAMQKHMSIEKTNQEPLTVTTK